ncbi:MAG: DNA-binding response regulator [Catenulispora sp. 13_1_20CM_3_70_7]|nr:MAG: DNA-binding response regulator [Catenulispora sp. 13_1_20CM_3_70_7]
MAPTTDRIRIILADDHTLFREGIKEILISEAGLDVLAEGGTAAEAVELVTRHRPDVAVIDVEMPGPRVCETVAHLVQRSPQTHVIVLTQYDDVRLAQDVIAAGARGFLVKGSTRHELISAVRSVCQSPTHVLVAVSLQGMRRAHEPAHRNPLTEREAEVLALTAQALSNAQIAHRLAITQGTVKRHLRNIYAKLGAVSRMDAVNKAQAASYIER